MGLHRQISTTSDTSSHFIGRRNILSDINSEWNKSVDQAPRFIVNIYGIGGIGKSRLLQQLLLKYAGENIVCQLDANFDDLTDPLRIIKSILTKLRKGGKPVTFKETEKLISRFDKLVKDASKAGIEIPSSAISKILVTGAQVGTEVLAGPATSKLIGKFGEEVTELVGAGIDQLTALWNSARDDNDRKLLAAPLRVITSQLIVEMNKNVIKSTKFILAIDTIEKLSDDVHSWLLKEFLSEPVPVNCDLRLIISGREALKDHNRLWYDTWGNETLPVNVPHFTLEETTDFLRIRCSIEDPEIIKMIYESTEGYPFWLDIWANSGLKPETFFSVSHLQKIEERLFDMFPDPKHQAWLRNASFFRHFNRDLLRLLLKDQVEDAFSWLISQSALLEGDGNFWKLHDIPRKIILNNLNVTSKKLFSDSVMEILSYLEKKLQKPWEQWLDLKYKMKIDTKDEEILTDISYYMALENNTISDRHLDILLRISGFNIDLFLSSSLMAAQALKDINVDIPLRIEHVIKYIGYSYLEANEEDLDKLKLEMSAQNYTSYQRAILLRHFAEGYKSINRTKKLLNCLKESMKLVVDFEAAMAMYVMYIDDFEERVRIAEKIIEHNPDHYIQVVLATLYTILDKHNEADKLHQKAVNLFPKVPLLYTMWATSLVNLNRTEEAMEKCEIATQIDPEYAYGYEKWGDCLNSLDRYSEALDKYQLAESLSESKSELYKKEGLTFILIRQFEYGIAKLELALQLAPDDVDINAYFGFALSELNRNEEAITKFEKVFELDTDYNKINFNKYWAIALTNLKRLSEACPKYINAAEYNNEDPEIFMYWGLCLIGLNKFEEAIEKFKTIINLNENYPKAHYFVGYILVTDNIKRYEEALDYFSKAARLDPNDIDNYIKWAYALQKLNRNDEAIKIYEIANQNKPDDPSVWENLGWLYYDKLSDYSKSIEASRQALSIDNKRVRARFNLAIVLLHVKDYESAIQEYLKCVSMIQKGEFSDSNVENNKQLIQEALEDLQNAKQKVDGVLLEQIEKAIMLLKKGKG